MNELYPSSITTEDQANVKRKNDLPSTLTKFIVVISVVLILILVGLLVYVFNQNKGLQNQVDELQSKVSLLSVKEESLEEIYKIDEERQLKYFKEDILPNFREDETIQADEVRKVYPLRLKTLNSSPAWLVVTQAENSLPSLYLLSSVMQKKLEHSMSDYSGDDSDCELDKVENEGTYVTSEGKLKSEDYIVISSINCASYGGGSSVAIYSLESGDKIKISGSNFKRPGSVNGMGISESGNALGRLRGVYGVKNPTVIIDYGNFESAASNIEKVDMMAFVDLRTGKLKSTEIFK